MSSPVIKYVGRTTNFKGKTLWEIVGSLKNYGVGRLIVRSVFERYPEPSFMKIVKVETCPHEVSITLTIVDLTGIKSSLSHRFIPAIACLLIQVY